ncbi:hypothetical protein DFA_06733 [Cavenderia fasciculata]|uniref:Uncharacterized protein n=1 Tax=Cavenderia fasciculata TaxID=261658 RepID=F4Q246_CACFS|nr:uncharacterized protein DFA_06733 [Cavenderia fasciculata]EGG18066.1 hypothetical protein DFA_06733 [Cavenderia fasciculata]|eukprot:XP_004356959.1 hypothetical protein DFA_06733 [Cavenderia fasciculata]
MISSSSVSTFKGNYELIAKKERIVLDKDGGVPLERIEYPWRDDYQNVCYASDLVVTFDMTIEQQEQYQKARQRYRGACLQAFEIRKEQAKEEKSSSKKRYLSECESNQQRFERILGIVCNAKSATTNFEQKQIQRNISLYLPPHVVCSPIDTYRIRDYRYIYALAAMGHKHHFTTHPLLDLLPERPTISFRQLMQRDRTGKIFQLIRPQLKDCIDQSPEYELRDNQYYDQSGSGSGNNSTPTHEAKLGRYDQDGSLHILYLTLEPHSSIIKMTKRIYTTNIENIQRHSFGSWNEAVSSFLEIFKLYTNRDYTNIDMQPFTPISSDYYGSLILFQPIKNQLPKFKEICFSVLKEKYLILKKETINIIVELPFFILQEFIKYCLDDSGPISFEIFKDIKKKWKEEKEQSSLPLDDEIIQQLLPLDYWIKSMFNRDRFIRLSYLYEIPQSPFHPNYSEDDLLINVFDSTDQFKLKQLPIDRILIHSSQNNNNQNNNNNNNNTSSSSSYSSLSSIVDKETFISNFNKNTNNIFKKEGMNWNNMIVIGGIVTSSLTGLEVGFEESDIDIIFYGVDYEKIKDRITQFYQYLGDHKQYSVSVTGPTIIFSKHYPQRHVQVEYCCYTSIEQVLLGTDIEVSCFAFDGTNVWTMQRGVEAINYRCNFASPYGHYIRGEGVYQRRLLKYLGRGFSIAHFTDNPYIIEQFGQSTIDPPLKPYIIHKEQNGVALLFSARDNPKLIEKLLLKHKEASLPYGPTWTKSNFEPYVQANYDRHYDGYASHFPKILLHSELGQNQHNDCYTDDIECIEDFFRIPPRQI